MIDGALGRSLNHIVIFKKIREYQSNVVALIFQLLDYFFLIRGPLDGVVVVIHTNDFILALLKILA